MLLLPGSYKYVKDNHFVGPLIHKWQEYSKMYDLVPACICVTNQTLNSYFLILILMK